MDLGLAGRRAVVTGGSKGLGQAIAAELLAEGAAVAICSRNDAELGGRRGEQLRRRRRAHRVRAMACDVTDPDQVTAFVAAAADGARRDRHPGQQRRRRPARAGSAR